MWLHPLGKERSSAQGLSLEWMEECRAKTQIKGIESIYAAKVGLNVMYVRLVMLWISSPPLGVSSELSELFGCVVLIVHRKLPLYASRGSHAGNDPGTEKGCSQ